jgi:hypothetical protein
MFAGCASARRSDKAGNTAAPAASLIKRRRGSFIAFSESQKKPCARPKALTSQMIDLQYL